MSISDQNKRRPGSSRQPGKGGSGKPGSPSGDKAAATGKQDDSRRPAPANRPRTTRALPDNEVKLCGLNACLALFRERPEDVVRVYVERVRLPEVKDFLQWCARTRRAYHVVDADELEHITHSRHHEGICVLARRRKNIPFPVLLKDLNERAGPHSVLLIEGIGNPHNLGAIVRVAAHFGVAALVLTGGTGNLPTLSSAVYRTAEGGLEAVPVSYAADGIRAARTLAGSGYVLIATSSHAKTSLFAAGLPARTVFLLGSEADGLSPALAGEAEICLNIPGTGAVESLNIACATAVLCAEFQRQHSSGKGAQIHAGTA